MMHDPCQLPLLRMSLPILEMWRLKGPHQLAVILLQFPCQNSRIYYLISSEPFNVEIDLSFDS